MLSKDIKGLSIAGFFGIDWSMDSSEFLWNELFRNFYVKNKPTFIQIDILIFYYPTM